MYEIVKNTLATTGLEVEIDPYTSKWSKPKELVGWAVEDVRDLSDGDEENPPWLYQRHIDNVIEKLERHGRVVIGCAGGQSRSNTIALGVLIERNKMNFYDAWELIKEKVPICNIDISHIVALKQLYNVTLP